MEEVETHKYSDCHKKKYIGTFLFTSRDMKVL